MGLTQDKQGRDAGPAGYLVGIGAGLAIASSLGLHVGGRSVPPDRARGRTLDEASRRDGYDGLDLYSVHLLPLITVAHYGKPATLECCPHAALIRTK